MECYIDFLITSVRNFGKRGGRLRIRVKLATQSIDVVQHPVRCDQARVKYSQKTRSDLQSLGCGCRRFMMAICWQRAGFSRARLERSRKAVRTSEGRRRIINIMACNIVLQAWKVKRVNADEILANDRFNCRLPNIHISRYSVAPV